MSKEFRQVVWDEQLQADWEAILRLAVAEDVGTLGDCTTKALVPADALGRAAIVARRQGVVAGLPAVEMTLHAVEPAAAMDARDPRRTPGAARRSGRHRSKARPAGC